MQCPWCSNYFCSQHRLPETHECGHLLTGAQPIKKQKEPRFEPLSERKKNAARDHLHEMVFYLSFTVSPLVHLPLDKTEEKPTETTTDTKKAIVV